MTQPEKKPDEQKPAAEPAIVFPLSKPIMAYGEEVKELRLREPNGADIVKIGNPVKFNPFADDISVDHDFQKVVAMAARLANVPSASLEKMDPQDLVGLAWAISPFFIPTQSRGSSERAST